MSELNQYEISRILGSKMTPVKQPRFGPMGVLQNTMEMLRAREESQSESNLQKAMADDEYRKVVEVFEEIRQGAPTDALLYDCQLANVFTQECWNRGVEGSRLRLIRGLLAVRKNPARFQPLGLSLSPTTKRASCSKKVLTKKHVIEFALVRLRYRYGASIDHILADEEMGNKFDQMTTTAAPGFSCLELRQGALYLRKSRQLTPAKLDKSDNLDVDKFENSFVPRHSLQEFHFEETPACFGLIEFKEKDRFLYITQTENIQCLLGQFSEGTPFEVMTSGFWQPQLDVITARYVAGRKINNTRTSVWESALIAARKPIFNWPTKKSA